MKLPVWLIAPVLLVVLGTACAPPMVLRGKEGAAGNAYDTLAYSIYEIRLRSEQINPDILRKFLKKELDDLNGSFEPADLLKQFPLLKLKPGTRLVYFYVGSPIWDGQGRVTVMDDGKRVLLNHPEIYRKYMDFERSPEGCIQYCLFCEELGLLTLKQHLNYSQSWFVPSYNAFLRICSKKVKLYWNETIGYWYDSLLPKPPGEGKHDSFWRKLKRADRSLMPHVTFKGAMAHVIVHRFSPFGGVYKAEYTVNTETGEFIQESGKWSFPIYRTGEYVVPFHCGVMF